MSRSLRFAPTALLVLLGAPGFAADLVTPQAFEALVVGRTLHFSRDGAPFGSEQYLEGRRTVWRYADGVCESGRWRAEGEAICFAYLSVPDETCWRFVDDGETYVAALIEDGTETGFRLTLDRMETAPLPCAAPPLGS